MLTIEQVRKRLNSRHELRGRLIISPDGSEWIRTHLTRSALNYYQARVTCYGFIPDGGPNDLSTSWTKIHLH